MLGLGLSVIRHGFELYECLLVTYVTLRRVVCSGRERTRERKQPGERVVRL